MNIQFYAKNIELSARVKDYIQDKIGGLDKFNLNVTECKTDLSKDVRHQKGDIYRFEVNIKIADHKKLIRSAVESSDIMAAIDQVKDKLQRQISKIKDMSKNR
ncbi:ribosome-associated translation inhibitor RaiA [bacterium]|nr:ribosome-associated translation inhibitor RaiA [bacterium]